MQDARYYHHPDERSFDAIVTGCRDYKDGLFASHCPTPYSTPRAAASRVIPERFRAFV